MRQSIDIHRMHQGEEIEVQVNNFTGNGPFVAVKFKCDDTDVTFFLRDMKQLTDLTSKLMNANLYPNEVEGE